MAKNLGVAKMKEIVASEIGSKSLFHIGQYFVKYFVRTNQSRC